MTENTTIERLKNVIQEQLGVDREIITENARFIEDLGCDSLDTVEMVMAAEDEFGITIPDEYAEKSLTVGEAVKTIDQLAAL